jgi:hypothetical protein
MPSADASAAGRGCSRPPPAARTVNWRTATAVAPDPVRGRLTAEEVVRLMQ